MLRFVHLFLLVGLLLPAGELLARIKLITLPVRERVELQLQHPEATLVQEERIVPLVAGLSQVDFSWNNARIDPDSVVLRLLGGVEAKVLSVSKPPAENALVWNLFAAQAGSVEVEVSYLLRQLQRTHFYRALANADETRMSLQHYLRLDNASGEAFDDVNLHLGQSAPLRRDLGRDERRDLLLNQAGQVAIRKRYTADVAGYGYTDQPQRKLRIPMHYVFDNSSANDLGLATLDFGKARIFIDDGKGGRAFLGEDWLPRTQIDEEVALFLGVARDIVVTRTVERLDHEPVNGDLHHLDLLLRYDIENFRDRPLVLDIREDMAALRSELWRDNGQREVEWQIGPETTLEGGLDAERSDYKILVFHQPLLAAKSGKAEKQTFLLHVLVRNEW